MRVLVTGASGAIGSALCDALIARGDEAVGLSRDPERARRTNPTLRWHPWEPTMERPPEAALEELDGVVNLIGESIDQRWTDESKRRILESRVKATHNLVQAITALERKPKVLVSQSAVGYYGNRGDSLVDEATGPGSGFGAEVPVEWEKAAREIEGTGVRLVITRSAPVLNPDSGMLKRMLVPFKLGVGGSIGGGGQYLPWIHLDDEVGILLWALDDDDVEGVVNAASPNPVTNREFSKTLGRVLRRPALMPVPNVALNLMLGRELAETVVGGARVVPRRTEDLGYRFRHPQLEAALRDLL